MKEIKKKISCTGDRLAFAGWTLKVLVLVTAGTFLAIAAMSINSNSNSMQMTATMILQLSLDSPSLVPSGSALGSKTAVSPAIDLRHSPFLPLIRFSPEAWTVDNLQQLR